MILPHLTTAYYPHKELELGIVVQVSDRELRYSRFPEIPLFGRAAREKRLEELQIERDEVAEQHAQIAFDVQKCQRFTRTFQPICWVAFGACVPAKSRRINV